MVLYNERDCTPTTMNLSELVEFLAICLVIALVPFGFLGFRYGHRWPAEGPPAPLGNSFPYRSAMRPTVRRGLPPLAVWLPAFAALLLAPVGFGYALLCLLVATLAADPPPLDMLHGLLTPGYVLMALAAPIVAILFLQAAIALFQRREIAIRRVKRTFVGSIVLTIGMILLMAIIVPDIRQVDLILFCIVSYPISILGVSHAMRRAVRTFTEATDTPST
jgi:hypothetical protein